MSMRSLRALGKRSTERSRRDTQTFLLDTNVLVAAMKNPARETETLRLLIRIIENQRIRLVADELLLEEMLRYAEILKSPTAAKIMAAILGKTTLVKVSENYRAICK